MQFHGQDQHSLHNVPGCGIGAHCLGDMILPTIVEVEAEWALRFNSKSACLLRNGVQNLGHKNRDLYAWPL